MKPENKLLIAYVVLAIIFSSISFSIFRYNGETCKKEIMDRRCKQLGNYRLWGHSDSLASFRTYKPINYTCRINHIREEGPLFSNHILQFEDYGVCYNE